MLTSGDTAGDSIRSFGATKGAGLRRTGLWITARISKIPETSGRKVDQTLLRDRFLLDNHLEVRGHVLV